MTRGLLDTNMLIFWDRLRPDQLPDRFATSTITLAELSAGIHSVPDPQERAQRIELLLRAEQEFDPIPFDILATRAYGRITAVVVAVGRSPRARVADQMIAAVALSRGLSLYTTNPDDFDGLKGLVDVVAVSRPK
jgi:predicted nucleic acid-binding protein